MLCALGEGIRGAATLCGGAFAESSRRQSRVVPSPEFGSSCVALFAATAATSALAVGATRSRTFLARVGAELRSSVNAALLLVAHALVKAIGRGLPLRIDTPAVTESSKFRLDGAGQTVFAFCRPVLAQRRPRSCKPSARGSDHHFQPRPNPFSPSRVTNIPGSSVSAATPSWKTIAPDAAGPTLRTRHLRRTRAFAELGAFQRGTWSYTRTPLEYRIHEDTERGRRGARHRAWLSWGCRSSSF